MNKRMELREWYLHCRQRGIHVDGHTAAIAIQAAGDYAGIRDRYYATIVEVVIQYLTGTVGMAKSKGWWKSLAATSFVDAFEKGWLETARGDTYEPESDDSEWLASRLNQELGYIDTLFLHMRAMLKDTEEPISLTDIDLFAENRANNYCISLDSVYDHGKLRGKKSVMLTFTGDDGSESCYECQKYKYQRHRARWWVSHDLVPAPGNDNFTCRGYQCRHFLQDDDGNVWAGNP